MANAEVLIIGCGIAGATAALRLARNPERQITIITRASDVRESNTRYAQGGIIGRGPDDTSQLLFADIMAAGAGVTSPTAARILADDGAIAGAFFFEQGDPLGRVPMGVGVDDAHAQSPIRGQSRIIAVLG